MKQFQHYTPAANMFWLCVRFQNPRPLYSFEDNADYVYDVQWSPIHPALFAAVDGTGRLDLWNLNNDTEVMLNNGLGYLLLEGDVTHSHF